METDSTVLIRAELFNMQRRMLEELTRGAGLNAVLRALCAEVEEWWRPSAVLASVLLVEGDFLRHGAGPSLPSGFMAAIDGEKRGPMVGSCGSAAYILEPVIVTDITTDPRWENYREVAQAHNLEACWSFPIMNRRGDDAIASLAIYTKKGVEPTDLEMKFMEGLADVSGLIINRAEMEQALTEETIKLNHLVSGSKIGMWEWDGTTGRLAPDDRILVLLGYSRDEFEGLSTDEQAGLVHPDDVEALTDRIAQHVGGGLDFFESDFRVKRKSGDWIWVRDRGRILSRNDDGSPARVLGTLQDINEQKIDENRLQRMQRLESLGRLAGGIAHDFNNIMVGIFGSISLAREVIEEGHPAAEDLALAEDSLQRARHLTTQLLTFARGGEPVKSDLDLAFIVRGVARFDLSGSNVVLHFEVDDDLWTISADQGQIQQVFSNLIINAVEAMGGKGELKIRLQNWTGEFDDGKGEGQYVRAEVEDSGPGIPRGVISEMFDPYFSTKDTGRGLGLATVHSIVSRHGGSVRVETGPEDGTTFEIFLPARSGVVPQLPSQAPEPSPGPKDLSVLILDDEPSVRRTAARMVEKLGHVAQLVSKGEQAVELYRQAFEAGSRFDIVILDLTISGGMGGRDAAEAILEMDPSARLLASSGYNDTSVMSSHEKNGFVATVPKPYTLAELESAFSRAFSRELE